jgi:glutamate N-acetyltransferase/amino-acid N-acetyltransferase
MKEIIVPGFKAASFISGLRSKESHDIALIVSETSALCAGVFTTNKVKAPPVLFSMENVRKGRARAIIANAGNANACTGKQGMKNTIRTAELVAREIGISRDEVLVASTGVIGEQLDMTKIERSIPHLVKGLSPEGLNDAAEAIMTTDSFPKISRFAGTVNNVPYTVMGIAKGAGMIMPDMATMLCFIITDVKIEQIELKKALSAAVKTTFNRITVDGDTSTNDTVFILANGKADNDQMKESDYRLFTEGVEKVMSELSVMIVKDGEGATKVVYLKVQGAASGSDAIIGARTVANSSLVKTAFYGQDPNWGRIMGALGRSGINMDEKAVDIFIDDIQIVEKGLSMGEEQEKMAAQRMKKEEFSVTINLNIGDFEDRITTCDLTHEYVSINADYRT